MLLLGEGIVIAEYALYERFLILPKAYKIAHGVLLCSLRQSRSTSRDLTLNISNSVVFSGSPLSAACVPLL